MAVSINATTEAAATYMKANDKFPNGDKEQFKKMIEPIVKAIFEELQKDGSIEVTGVCGSPGSTITSTGSVV